MRWKRRSDASSADALQFVMVAALAVLLTGCATTMVPGDAGCASYAEVRLARPSPETITQVSSDWAAWIADLDDRMTGTCR